VTEPVLVINWLLPESVPPLACTEPVLLVSTSCPLTKTPPADAPVFKRGEEAGLPFGLVG
jgi:hypothetical protein